MRTSQRRRPPSRRFKAAFKAERPETDEIPLGIAVADDMAMVHNFKCSDVWMRSLPADNIERCSCSAFARSVHYVKREGIKREIDPLFSG
jgi:hypothetical protein